MVSLSGRRCHKVSQNKLYKEQDKVKTLTKPKKFEDAELWVVYITENGYLTGQSGVGSTPEEATSKAQDILNEELEAE